MEGRKGWNEKLLKEIVKGDPHIWVHCSSAGEFEQAKPLAEALKHIYPQYKLLFSFFSPSGYNAAKKYTSADVITYLPIDKKKMLYFFTRQ